MIESEKSRLFSAFFQILKVKKSPEYLGFRIVIETEKSRLFFRKSRLFSAYLKTAET